MKKHKYELVLKFVQLNGFKEFKETDPSLFSKDGVSTLSLEIDNGKNIPVTMEDARRACQMFLDNKLTLNQLQQWGEWIHMMDFFDLIPNGEAPDYDESLINALTDIDNIDLVEKNKARDYVSNIQSSIDDWLRKHQSQ